MKGFIKWYGGLKTLPKVGVVLATISVTVLLIFTMVYISVHLLMTKSTRLAVDTKTPIEQYTEQQAEDYHGYIMSHSDEFGETVTQFGERMSNYNIGNEWAINMATTIGVLQGLIDEAYAYDDVPVLYREAHAEYLKGMDEFKIVTDGMPEALDTMDAERIESLSSHIDRGAFHIEFAMEKIAELDDINAE